MKRMTSLSSFMLQAATLFARLCGAIFLYAGFRKAIDPGQIALVFDFYHFSKGLNDAAVWTITLGEIALGTMLLVKPMHRQLLYGLIAILFVYSVNLVILYSNARAPRCGCMMQLFEEGKHEKVFGIVRNSILIAGVGFAIFSSRFNRAKASTD